MEQIMALTDGKGTDAAIEALGVRRPGRRRCA